MTAQLTQLDSRPILYYTFAGPITLDDLNGLVDEERLFYASITTGDCYHVVVDLREVETINAALFPKLQQMSIAVDDRICAVIVVGANPYLRALTISLGMSTRRKPMIFCATMDEALAHIKPAVMVE